MDAPGQGVGGGQVGVLLLLFPRDAPQFNPLSDLNQDAVGVVVAFRRGEGPLLHFSQMKAASFQGGENLIHG